LKNGTQRFAREEGMQIDESDEQAEKADPSMHDG
jgi:hypothetical protein